MLVLQVVLQNGTHQLVIDLSKVVQKLSFSIKWYRMVIYL